MCIGSGGSNFSRRREREEDLSRSLRDKLEQEPGAIKITHLTVLSHPVRKSLRFD